MNADAEKRQAAEQALNAIEEGMVVGVGSGSTVRFFIEGLARHKNRIEGAVSSSEQTTQLLKAQGIPVLDLNACGTLPLYVDGADECDPHRRLVKGGGGALTREKIIAAASQKFICIIDSSKRVPVLGKFPVAIEVIPMARSYVGRQLVALGAVPAWREGFVTDNGNVIIDAHQFRITDPVALERDLNQIAGVVSVGLFARRPADVVICGSASF